MLVGVLFIGLLIALIVSILYGQRLIRTEKSDLVFGNPSRALGGWHWMVAGVASILLLWYWFSWDAARAFFPKAANELCQVAKLHRAANPIRSIFPFDGGRLQGTELLLRDHRQIDRLSAQLAAAELSQADHTALAGIIDTLRATLNMQADPALLAPATEQAFADIARRIEQLADELSSAGYPGPADPALWAKAQAQPGWGEGRSEIPVLPQTGRGRVFHTAAERMTAIARDFQAIRHQAPALLAALHALETRIRALTPDRNTANQHTTARDELVKQINKIYRRIDDGRIFPPAATDAVERALIRLNAIAADRQGGLTWIDTLVMPGGHILAGNRACSEQGAGRWLPKPSDTLDTFLRLADPEQGYKGFPLLWYRWMPIADAVGFVLPDAIADLIPGELPRHRQDGAVVDNLKSRVTAVVTGNFDSPSIPVLTGHIWDSIIRVIAGLFLGILFGVPLGLFMGLSRFAKGYFDPLIELYRPIPPLAWAPLILTIFGIQDDGKIFLLFMVAFAIMVISARTGATGTKLSKIHAAHSLGASNAQIIRQVILPNSLPEILTGIRIAIGVCWGTLVAAEMLAGTTGIGFVENVARKQSDYEIIWMTIIIMGLLGLMFDIMMRRIIQKTIPWRGQG